MKIDLLAIEKDNKFNTYRCFFSKKQIKVEPISTYILVCKLQDCYIVPQKNHSGFLEDNFDNLSVSLRKRECERHTQKYFGETLNMFFK